MTPDQRVLVEQFDIGVFGRRVTATNSALEKVTREELLATMPSRISEEVIQSGDVNTGRLTLQAMKDLLPAEDVARVALMDAVEKGPASMPRNYAQLAQALLEWATLLQVTVKAMRGNPDAQRLASAVRKVSESFRADPGLVYSMGRLMDKWSIRTRPNIQQILGFVAE